MIGPIMRLAKDIDQFAYDYDTYDYWDSVPNREQAVESLYLELLSGKTLKGLEEYFTEIIDEHDEWEEVADILLNRIQSIS